MGNKALKIVSIMVGGALLIGLAIHAGGAAQLINAVTGFFGTGLSAELGQAPGGAGPGAGPNTPPPRKKGQNG